MMDRKVQTRWWRRGVAAAIATSILAIAAPANAASGTQTLPNGCRITGSNSFSSNVATATTTKVSGYPCYTIEVKFTYYDGASGTYKQAGGGYYNLSSIQAQANTSVKPSMSSHNAHSVAGDTAWGFGVYF